MNIIFIAIGSHGDVNPLIGIGSALKNRGHAVTMLANPYFEKKIRDSGFEYVPVGTLEEYHRAIDMLSGPSMKRVINDYLYIRPMKPVYEYLSRHYGKKETVVVGNIYCTGARLAREKFGIPMISTNLVPMMFVSSYDPPVFTFTRYPRWTPRFVFSLMIAVAHAVVDRDLVPAIRQYRKQIGLPSRLKKVNRWMLSPDKIIGLFPDWYGRPQPDWPDNIELVGFPLCDEAPGQNRALPAELEEFLSAGDAPIIFTPGTPNKSKYVSFFQKAVEATKQIGARAVFVTPFREQVPRELPPHVRYYPYLPFSRVFPRASAVVFHGGIGTIAQAMRAGIPQLIAPWGIDQFDNGARIKALGLGDMISSLRCTVDSLAGMLRYVINSPDIQKRCDEVSGRIQETDPIHDACRIIEEFGAA